MLVQKLQQGNRWNANGWILSSSGVPSGRVCYQRATLSSFILSTLDGCQRVSWALWPQAPGGICWECSVQARRGSTSPLQSLQRILWRPSAFHLWDALQRTSLKKYSYIYFNKVWGKKNYLSFYCEWEVSGPISCRYSWWNPQTPLSNVQQTTILFGNGLCFFVGRLHCHHIYLVLSPEML